VNDKERKNSLSLRLDGVRLRVDEVNVQTVDARLELDEILSQTLRPLEEERDQRLYEDSTQAQCRLNAWAR